MEDEEKAREQLIDELAELRERFDRLNRAEAERKQMKQSLRESEERFRSTFEQAAVGIVHTVPRESK